MGVNQNKELQWRLRARGRFESSEIRDPLLVNAVNPKSKPHTTLNSQPKAAEDATTHPNAPCTYNSRFTGFLSTYIKEPL